MTKSSTRKAAAEKTRGTHRKAARKVGAAKAHSKARKTASKVAAEREHAVHIARPPLASRNSLTMPKCQSRCAPSPRTAWLRRGSFMRTLSKLY